MYYLRSDNKGADQLYGQHAADLRLCFRICIKRFSHDVAHLLVLISTLKDDLYISTCLPSDPESICLQIMLVLNCFMKMKPC